MQRSKQRRDQDSPSPFLRSLRRLFTVVIILVLVPLGINLHMIFSTQGKMHSPEALQAMGLDAALVFGAGLNPDGSPSPILAERLDQGIELYKDGACHALLLSGDGSQDSYYNETRAMAQYAMAQGISAEDLWQDPYGLSTRHSLERAQRDFGLDELILVSQRFHLTRALYLAQAQDLVAYGVPSDRQKWPNQSTREVPARLKDFSRVQISRIPEPFSTFLLEEFDRAVSRLKKQQEG